MFLSHKKEHYYITDCSAIVVYMQVYSPSATAAFCELVEEYVALRLLAQTEHEVWVVRA